MIEPVRSDDSSRHATGRLVRFTAAAALFWENLWPLLVPAACVVLGFLIVSWLGLWRELPQAGRYAGLSLFAAALVAALMPLRLVRLPDSGAITRRIERASRLEDRPITAQEDRLAMGDDDPFASALWQEHRRRMATRLRNLTGGTPAPRANLRDPWALRAFLAVLAFAALGFSYGSQGGRVSDALRAPVDPAEVLSRLDAWIDPPTYTRRPPIYLRSNLQDNAAGTISAPQGSRLTLRYVGDGTISAVYMAGDETVAIEAAEDAAEAIPAATGQKHGGVQLAGTIDSSGEIRVYTGDELVAQWPIEVIPDEPPSIAFAQPPSPALSGSLQLSYEVADDYGVVRADTTISSLLETDPEARPLVDPPEAPLTLPRKRARSGSARVNRDLTSHPWAGSEVAITLHAYDDAGQSGSSETETTILPGRRFTNPLALALIEQRRILALDARKAPRVADMLDAVLTAPEEFIEEGATVIAMNVARRRIIDAADDDALRSAVDLLWDIAMAVEYGDLSEAERKLREAQERLSNALENGASDEEIARLMEELRQAMNEFMQMLAQEALQNPMTSNPFEQNDMTRMLSRRDLERMMDQIENLARSGSRDAARELLSELQRMMDNLRAGRHMQQRRGEGNQMNQALDQLSELMRQQQELMDETFRMQRQDPRNQGNQNGQPQPGQPGDNGQMTPEQFAEAMKRLQEAQEGLQQQLKELGETLEGMGLDPSEDFGEAGREMGEAGENLGQRNPGSATTDQGQALEALRRGAQSMMQQMAGDRNQGGQQAGRGDQGGRDRQRADPLGREQQQQGLETGQETKVPDEIDAQRAREIMEAIRNRLARPSSPLIEKKYLERLLDTE